MSGKKRKHVKLSNLKGSSLKPSTQRAYFTKGKIDRATKMDESSKTRRRSRVRATHFKRKHHTVR